jgi:hypothetical protein
MKRSEMVARLDKAINEAPDVGLSGERLMNLIEKAGMLPPNVCWLATGEYESAKVAVSLVEEDYDCSISWEEE